MKIARVRHRGLRRFIENDDASGLPGAFVEKIRNIVSFLQEMDHTDELKALRSWRAHQLTGDRRGTWSLAVTKNWRITFAVDEAEKAIIDLNYEDYH
jgi:proteic killer suppression protein